MASIETTITQSVLDIPPAWREFYTTTNEAMYTEQPTYAGYTHHTQRSHDTITQAADESLRTAPSGERRALILGSGNCLDIPLRHVVSEFDHTRFVDIDAGATERALSDLPAGLLGKISLLSADVSGLIAKLGMGLDRLNEQRLDDDTFHTEIGQLLRSVIQKPSPPDLGTGYTFVSSHLLLSQLINMPMRMLSKLRARDPLLPEILQQAHGAFNDSVELFKLGLQRRHAAQLAGGAASGGVVHFADTFSAITPGVPVMDQIINPEIITPLFRNRFDLLTTTHWQWRLSPSIFAVVALAMRRK